jgi:hypothetical protein
VIPGDRIRQLQSRNPVNRGMSALEAFQFCYA